MSTTPIASTPTTASAYGPDEDNVILKARSEAQHDFVEAAPVAQAVRFNSFQLFVEKENQQAAIDNESLFRDKAMHADDTLLHAIGDVVNKDSETSRTEYNALVARHFPAPPANSESLTLARESFRKDYQDYLDRWNARSQACRQIWQAEADRWKAAYGDHPWTEAAVLAAFDTPPPLIDIKAVPDPSGKLEGMRPTSTLGILDRRLAKSAEQEVADQAFRACLEASEGSPERRWADLTVLADALRNGVTLAGQHHAAGMVTPYFSLDRVNEELAKSTASTEFQEAWGRHRNTAVENLLRTHGTPTKEVTALDPWGTPSRVVEVPPERSALVAQWKTRFESPEYRDWLTLMSPQEQAQQVKEDLRELAFLDPASAAEASAKLQPRLLAANLAATAPDSIDDAAGELAARITEDWIKVSAAKLGLLAVPRLNSAANLWNVYKTVCRDGTVGSIDAWRAAADAMPEGSAHRVSAFVDAVDKSGSFGAMAGILGLTATILKWTPGEEKNRMLREGDSWSALEFVNDIRQVVDVTDYLRVLSTMAKRANPSWDFAATMGLGKELGLMLPMHVRSLRPIAPDVVKALNNVNLRDVQAVEAALREHVSTPTYGSARYDVRDFARRIAEAAKAESGPTTQSFTLGGPTEDAQKPLADFVARNFAPAPNRLTARIQAEASVLVDVPLDDAATVSSKLSTVSGMGADEAAALAQRIKTAADEWPQGVHVTSAGTPAQKVTMSKVDDLVDLLFKVREQPLQVSAASAVQSMDAAADALDVSQVRRFAGVSMLKNVQSTASIGRNISLFLKGAGTVLDVLGGAASIALGIHGMITDKGDPMKIAANTLGIAGGIAGLGAAALGFTVSAALATPLSLLALGLGMTAFFLGNADLFVKPERPDHLGNFIERFKGYDVGRSDVRSDAGALPAPAPANTADNFTFDMLFGAPQP